MKQDFIGFYSHAHKQPQNINACGMWLLHGNESLLSQWFIDVMRPIWQAHGSNLQRIELQSTNTWHEVLAELNSLSLFDDACAIVVTGKHKPNADIQNALVDFANQINNNNNQNALVWTIDKQNKKSLEAQWAKPFINFGTTIDCNLYNEHQRKQILQIHAHNFGLDLTNDAWQFLMTHTENNLLGAYQTLWRLSFEKEPKDKNNTDQKTVIDIDLIQNSISNDSHYSTFDLSDAMLNGDNAKVIDIMHWLKHVNEPAPLVLWTINKEVRLIKQLLSGTDLQSLGIWRNKQHLYRQALNRHSLATTASWSQTMFRCDQAIKGMIKQPEWELLLQAALMVSGVQLFEMS